MEYLTSYKANDWSHRYNSLFEFSTANFDLRQVGSDENGNKFWEINDGGAKPKREIEYNQAMVRIQCE